MDKLPIELLENILTDSSLSIKDVSNVALTCRYLYNSVVNSSVIWKWRFFEKCPKFAAFLDKKHNSYFKEFQYIYDLKKRIHALLAKMPRRFYRKYHLSDVDLEEWNTIVIERGRSYHYVCLILAQIVNTKSDIKSMEVVPFNTPGNKTMQYYAMKVLRYIKQLYLSKELITYMSLPSKSQTLERLAVFVAQWLQSEINISYSSIAEELDRYADLVRRTLYEENPNHSLFNVPKERLDLWRVGKLTKNQFENEEFYQIFEALNQVFFIDLGFDIDDDFKFPENLSINKVLETKDGPSSILLIIYESVGRRLGLIFKPVNNFSRTFLLRFTNSNDPWAARHYIDVSLGDFGLINKGFQVATAQEVIEWVVEEQELAIRMMSYRQPTNKNATRLKRSIMELRRLVAPKNLINLGKLAKFYLSHNMNSRSLQIHLMNVPTITSSCLLNTQLGRRIFYMLRNFSKPHEHNEETLSQIKVIQRERTEIVKFAVGMVMTHTKDNRKCVITSWDPICLASLEWQTRNGVSELSAQPFYYVLREDDSREYVAQEHLIPSAEAGSLHLNLDLGQYFSHYFEKQFVPNAETQKRFPADAKVRHKFYLEVSASNADDEW